jgi:glycosyltransferase involved in cell wall biosynthesis
MLAEKPRCGPHGSGAAQPLISVVTVSLNAVEYIEQCIESVFAQDFDDYEYVIIDGGSRDGTQEIIERYEHRLTYWHSKPDRGQAHAFNDGIGHSSGKWLLFLNSDDYLCNSSVLSRLAHEAIARPAADVIYGQIIFVSREASPEPIVNAPFGGRFSRWEFFLRNMIPHPAALTNRQYFERVGLFREDLRIAMDYELYLRSGSSLKAHFVPVRVACMREGGTSKTNIKQALAEWLKAILVTKALPQSVARLLYWALVFRYATKGHKHRRT